MLRMGLDVNGAEFITDHFLEMEMLGSESAETGNPVEPSPHAAPEGHKANGTRPDGTGAQKPSEGSERGTGFVVRPVPLEPPFVRFLSNMTAQRYQ
jgi:hypothetical protein